MVALMITVYYLCEMRCCIHVGGSEMMEMGVSVDTPTGRLIRMAKLDGLPDLVLSRLADYLSPEETARLSLTCRHLHDVLPRFTVIRGKDFTIYGPRGGHWAPELYFDGPPLTSTVRKLTLSLKWEDQGWGNRKGEIFMKLMRLASGDSASRQSSDAQEVAEKRRLFGIAKHQEEEAKTEITDDPVVALARPGDFYRFMRNAGGGGGHTLTVKNFRVVATLD